MNERIRELAEQTGLIPKTFGPVVQTRHMKKKEQDLEKFAELVVRECANIAYEVGLHRQTKHEILRRFGLEVTDEN